MILQTKNLRKNRESTRKERTSRRRSQQFSNISDHRHFINHETKTLTKERIFSNKQGFAYPFLDHHSVQDTSRDLWAQTHLLIMMRRNILWIRGNPQKRWDLHPHSETQSKTVSQDGHWDTIMRRKILEKAAEYSRTHFCCRRRRQFRIISFGHIETNVAPRVWVCKYCILDKFSVAGVAILGARIWVTGEYQIVVVICSELGGTLIKQAVHLGLAKELV